MAAPQYKQAYTHKRFDTNSPYGTKYTTNLRRVRRVKKREKVQSNNSLQIISVIILFVVFALFVSPVYTDNIVRPIILRTEKYPQIKTDINLLAFPTSAYLYNNHILGVNLLSGTEKDKPQMQKLYETYHINNLEKSLENLAASYPALRPSVYVWDYESGKYADINAQKVYSTASIIKIPVLIQLFRAIEMGMISLDDKISMTDYYKSEGSGSLQFKGQNAVYSVDELARVMITESDNSATNMLMDATGGMNAMNQSLRKWGMKETRVNDWLPDLAGTNVTTAKEMAAMLYNIDNPNFLTLNSREKIVDYMSHVHNNRLIQAGLPPEAIFIHKTGDIGKMLGDAGIVYTPNGKKYIVVMLVNRPYNSPQGKDFIVQASSLIYNYMTNVNL